jgi:hypothetical protein
MARYNPRTKISGPSYQVAETMHGLSEIMHAYESAFHESPVSTPKGGVAPDAELEPVLAAVLEPLVEMCVSSAEAVSADAPSRVDEVSVPRRCWWELGKVTALGIRVVDPSTYRI